MFGLFKKKPKEKKAPQLFDLKGNPLEDGDMVLAHRYELGKSQIIMEELHFYYESVKTKKKVSYTRMVDAITGHQKVDKLEE